MRVFRLAHGNPGQHRVLTDGVVELVLLLVGGDKSTQQQDIKSAIRLAKEI